MDGNGRWAQRRGHPRVFGHIRGSARVKTVVREANHLGVKALTLYAFSTENWKRPEAERSVIWKLLKKYLKQNIDELHEENVRLRVIGERERLDPDLRTALDEAVERLSENTGMQLTFALSYGSQRELCRAAKLFAEDCLSGKASPESMDENVMERYLWTSQLEDFAPVDLFIRTSGEYRVINFMLWQSAYAEFVFTGVFWPYFSS